MCRGVKNGQVVLGVVYLLMFNCAVGSVVRLGGVLGVCFHEGGDMWRGAHQREWAGTWYATHHMQHRRQTLLESICAVHTSEICADHTSEIDGTV